jgi:hypothetical protein
MEQTLSDLSPEEKQFILLAHVECKKFDEIAQNLGVTQKTLSIWETELRPIWKPIAAIKAKWRSKAIGGNFWDFYYWYISQPKHCHYCKVTQAELDIINNPETIVNSRPRRGKTFEIDQRNSKGGYSNLKNLVLSCYWCNNAKTDTFTEDEFMIIAQGIQKVWDARLGKDVISLEHL